MKTLFSYFLKMAVTKNGQIHIVNMSSIFVMVMRCVLQHVVVSCCKGSYFVVTFEIINSMCTFLSHEWTFNRQGSSRIPGTQ